MIPWGRVREEWRLDIAVSQIFIFSNAVSEEKSPSWLPRVHHLKYCELLCMDLNRGHTCFSYPRHWWMKKIWESCILYFVAGSLAVFEELQRTWSWKKKKPFSQFVHCVCMVCVDWCRFSETKCLDEIIPLMQEWKSLPFWYVLGVLWILLLY